MWIESRVYSQDHCSVLLYLQTPYTKKKDKRRQNKLPACACKYDILVFHIDTDPFSEILYQLLKAGYIDPVFHIAVEHWTDHCPPRTDLPLLGSLPATPFWSPASVRAKEKQESKPESQSEASSHDRRSQLVTNEVLEHKWVRVTLKSHP